MVKISISYKFSGEDPEIIEKNLGLIRNLLEEKGFEVFSTFWKSDYYKKNNFNHTEIIKDFLSNLNESDIQFVFDNSQEKSEGLFIETGYAYAKKKYIILAIRDNVKRNFLEDLANEVIKFSSIEDLKNKLKKLKIIWQNMKHS